MLQFTQQMINGLTLGGVYALVALGYTMVYGIIKLINFAHGDMYMVGAYIGFMAITVLRLPFALALPLSMTLTALLGILIERVAYKPLRNSTRVAALITAIGISFFLENIMIYFLGAEVRTFPEVMKNTSWEYHGLRISFQQIVIIVTTIVLMILLQIIVRKTKIGRAMRCVSVDAEAAKLMGVNVETTISLTFAVGSALAAAGGLLVGVYYNTINPLMGVVPGLKAFVAAVLGGIGIIPGAMIGGYAIGLIETMVSGYGSSLYKDAVVFIILIVILIVRPGGLLGKNRKEKV